MYKPLADSTLHSMTKKEIIELLRIAEHNAKVSQEQVEQQAENIKDWVPVVHGDWVRPHWRNSNFCYDCSVCGNEVMHQEYRWRDKKIYLICPWCGAKMRENNEI